MKFNEVMHLAFYTGDMEAMRDFYVNKLGLTEKIIMRYEAYKGNEKRKAWAEKAETDPQGIAYLWIELAPGQYMELFPAYEKKENPLEENTAGYSHYALMVDDIFKAREELVNHGVEIDIEPNKGQSETWQMWIHDPDGNKFEIMQYTDNSLQFKGNIEEDRARYGN